MLAKITKGQNFYGCLSYVLGKAEAEVIDSNMVGRTAFELTTEFRLSLQQHQRRASRKQTRRVVCHISLSMEIGSRLKPETWSAIAQDYLSEMGFDQNQYVLVQHTDTDHQHVHLVVSRLRIDGSTVPDWLDYQRTEMVLRSLEQKYKLQPTRSSWETEVRAPTVGEIRQFRRTQQPSVRTILQVAIDDATEGNPSFATFSDRLKSLGVSFRLRLTPVGVKGISYKFHDISFPGHKLGKRYTWQGLQTYLGVQYESTNAATSQETFTGINLTTGEREHDFINTLPHTDDPTRTTRTTRTSNQSSTQQTQAHSGTGQSRRKADTRSTAPIATDGLSNTDASPIGGIESGINKLEAPIRRHDRSDEPILGESGGYDHPDHEVDSGIAGNQRQPAISHSSSEYPDRTTAETVGYDRENGQSTSSTRPDQTQSNPNLRTLGTLQPLDRLRRSSDDSLWTASDESTRDRTSSPIQPEEPEVVSISEKDGNHLWQFYSQDVQTKNPVEKDLIVAWKASQDGCDREQVIDILWQSPYVKWLQETQGVEKTQSYINLTVRAAMNTKQRTSQRQPSQQQKSQQYSL